MDQPVAVEVGLGPDVDCGSVGVAGNGVPVQVGEAGSWVCVGVAGRDVFVAVSIRVSVGVVGGSVDVTVGISSVEIPRVGVGAVGVGTALGSGGGVDVGAATSCATLDCGAAC